MPPNDTKSKWKENNSLTRYIYKYIMGLSIYFSRCIIALTEAPPRSHLLYVLGVDGLCSLVLGVTGGWIAATPLAP